MVVTAYPWIAACALAITGCNQILGLDDDSRFQFPDGPVGEPDALVVTTCLNDSFTEIRPEIWSIVPGTPPWPIGISGNAVQFEIQGPDTNEAGLVSKGTFDFTGGSAEITILDPSSELVEAGIWVIDGNNRYGVTSRDGLLVASRVMNGLPTITGELSSDTRLRLLHDSDTGALAWQSAPTVGAPFTDIIQPVVISPPKAITIGVLGQSKMPNAVDGIVFDDLLVSTLCP